MVTTPWAALPGPGPVASVHAAERGVLREGRWHDKPSQPGEANVTANAQAEASVLRKEIP
jgi:hypothetical protein